MAAQLNALFFAMYVFVNLSHILACSATGSFCQTDRRFQRVSDLSSAARLEQVNVMLRHRICHVADSIHRYFINYLLILFNFLLTCNLNRH